METTSPEAPSRAPARKPYRRPEITFHEPLELFAAVCTPGKADVATCPLGPISS
jgi:hypothetical protein